MNNLLIIDDEKEMLKSLEKILSQRDFKLSLVQNGMEALNLVQKTQFDLIITDLKMPDISGMDILKAALEANAESKVIVISGYGTIEASVQAMQAGAFDFLEKPFTSKKLFRCIDRALIHNTDIITDDNKPLKKSELPGLIYKSEQIANIVKIVHKISAGEMNVLITGESGTGKEVVARAIHGLSKRKVNPFVPVNCGALPENLFESELFGHEKGAFTGAVKTKPGLLEFANQGTFFFDEIGELSLTLQVKLLRMLEDRQIRRVGGQKEIDIDVRIITATNKDLSQAARESKFREDLYYRLNTIQIEIPPLRERPVDIVPLAYHFLKELNMKNDKTVQRFSADAEEIITEYAWPGNVRELQNMISRAYYLCSLNIIQKVDLPLPVTEQSISMDRQKLNQNYKDAKEYILEKFEVEYLTYHLKKHQGNISQTANECGLDRRSIHRLIKKYNIVYQE
jgi:two-component system response regulator AtoC